MDYIISRQSMSSKQGRQGNVEGRASPSSGSAVRKEAEKREEGANTLTVYDDSNVLDGLQ